MDFPDVSHPARKRSVTLKGHATSVTLEQPFWDALIRLAAREGGSVNSLIAAIDAARGDNNLSSALRLYVLSRAASSP